MVKKEFLAFLEDSEDDPVELNIDDLPKINVSDLPERCRFRVVSQGDEYLIEEVEGEFVVDNDDVKVLMFLNWYRKYWSNPIGMPQYMDLLKRQIEFRESEYGDVSFTHFEDEGDWCHLHYEISIGKKNNLKDLDEVFQNAQKVIESLQEQLDNAEAIVSKKLEEIKSRISLYEGLGVEQLVTKVETERNPQKKGQFLETLLVKLFERIEGFEVSDRIRTSTEEIDLVILNTSSSEFWKKESPVILVEAKNRTNKTDKNDVVQFQSKIRNRKGRSKLGIIVSSSQFTRTVNDELLRSSDGDILILPMLLSEVIEHINDFESLLRSKWKEMVTK